MMGPFVVRFVRRDRKPSEDYYYHSYVDAEHHLRLFEGDDSGLYDRIVLMDSEETVLCSLKITD